MSLAFNIDICKLIGNTNWQFLLDVVTKRNRIIHHASFEKNGKAIQISQNELAKTFSLIDNFILKFEYELFNKKIVI